MDTAGTLRDSNGGIEWLENSTAGVGALLTRKQHLDEQRW